MIQLPTYMEEIEAYVKGFGIQHFVAREFVRPAAGGVPPRDLWPNIVPTLLLADEAREELGPIAVWSGYRTGPYNARVGGATRSTHVAYNALDLHPIEASVEELHRFFRQHEMKSKLGLGRYDRFVHIDTRGLIGRVAPARWDMR